MTMEITFSNELKIHGENIRQSKNRIGQEIIFIGKELTDAKAKCKHGEWLLFLEQEAEIEERTAQEFMQIFREFGNTSVGTDLGKKAFLFLTRLPQEEKEKVHELSTGEKTIYEMNHKEVNELKKKLEQEKKEKEEAENKAKQIEEENKKLELELITERKKEKSVHTITKVVKDDLEVKRVEQELTKLKNKYKNLENEKKELELKLSDNVESKKELEDLKKELYKISNRKNNMLKQIENLDKINQFLVQAQELFENLTLINYSSTLKELQDNEMIQDQLNDLIENVENWLHDIKGIIGNKKFIQAEIIEAE